jgi:hypothetical protein
MSSRKPKPFAVDTSVSTVQTQQEIEALVKGRGAVKYFRGEDEGRAVIAFDMKDRKVMFELPLEQVHKAAKESQARSAKLERQLWRSLFLCIKAKLVSVETGVETFEDAFLAQLIVPTAEGRATRFGKVARAAIKEAYDKGAVPNFGFAGLLGSGEDKKP